MITYPDGGNLIETIEEIPTLPDNIDKLIIDFETTSQNDKVNSLNPWKNCEVLGVAFNYDSSPVYYYPVRQRNPSDLNRNLPIDAANRLVEQLISRSKTWVNHNVKYDAHVAANSAHVNILDYPITLMDTVTQAKLVDSDEFNYSLDAVALRLLGIEIGEYAYKFKPYLYHPGGNIKCKDYGVVPLDFMAPYACQDVITVQKLHEHLNKRLLCHRVWETEQALTKILFDMEQNGLLIDGVRAFKDMWDVIPNYMSVLKKEIHDLTGKWVEPNKAADCYDLLIDYYRLPVVEYTEGGKNKKSLEPSFGKVAIKAYLEMPGDHVRVVELIGEYRKVHKLRTGFIAPYLNLFDDKIKLHPQANQCVRTGRLSYNTPNMQQLPKEAKEYILAEPGRVIIEFDLKQIEYRIIAHYIKNERLLTEYNNNPEADFHDVTARFCGISRDAAKTMNFMVSFGGGKGKTVLTLRASLTSDDLPEGESFDDYCERRGLEIYEKYHANLPELKKTSYRAGDKLKLRGYVKNHYGRIRTMPKRFHYKAFNNVIQSSAADYMKEVTVRLHTEIKESGRDIKMLGTVHDSWVFSAPEKGVNDTMSFLQNTIETTKHSFSVPIYCSGGYSAKNWRETDAEQRGRNWLEERLEAEALKER